MMTRVSTSFEAATRAPGQARDPWARWRRSAQRLRRCPLRYRDSADGAWTWRGGPAYDSRRTWGGCAMRTITFASASASALLLAACSGGHPPVGDDTADPDAPTAGDPDASNPDDPDARPDGNTGGATPTIFTIVLENQDYEDVVGSPNAPYLNSLIAQYGLATNYKETGS